MEVWGGIPGTSYLISIDFVVSRTLTDIPIANYLFTSLLDLAGRLSGRPTLWPRAAAFLTHRSRGYADDKATGANAASPLRGTACGPGRRLSPLLGSKAIIAAGRGKSSRKCAGESVAREPCKRSGTASLVAWWFGRRGSWPGTCGLG